MSADEARAVISKSLPVTLSFGFILAIIAMVFLLGDYKGTAEAQHASMDSQIERNTKRFNQYSGAEGSNTLDIETLKERIEALEKQLSVLHGEEVGR